MDDREQLVERMDRMQDELDGLWGLLQRAELLVEALEGTHNVLERLYPSHAA